MKTMTERSLHWEAASAVARAAVAHAEELGVRIHVSVVDRAGLPLAYLRMNGAFLHSQGIAEDKAYTAASFGFSTRDWLEVLGGWHGILPLHGAVTCCPDGQQAGIGDLMMFTPGHEVQVIWHEGTRALVIGRLSACLNDHLKRHHQSEPAGVSAQAQLIGRQHPALRSLGNLVRLIDSEAGSPSGLLATPVDQQHLQHLFCENLLHLIPTLGVLPQRSLLPGTVKRVVDYIHAHLDQPLRISQLVQISGASRPSLEQAFRRYLGTSPQRYIQRCKLNAIRELQPCELAFRWGFAQPSHFTTTYKQAFGERPSETLNRHP